MYKLVVLLKRVYVPLLFILFEILAIHYYTHSTSYTKARLLTVSNSAIGGIQRGFKDIGDYFSLKGENELLLEQVTELENRLARYAGSETTTDTTANDEIPPYFFSSARVLSNSIARQDNFIILDKGQRDGVEADMAVLSIEGSVVGYVVECTEKFSVCMSLLNRNFTMGGKVKGKDFFGSVNWDGRNHRYANLTDIPRYAPIQKGDTILSTISFRFPPDMMVGTIEEFSVADDQTNYNVKVKLASSFATLRNIILVKYTDAKELESIQNDIDALNAER